MSKAIWKSRSLFISSTFKDMQVERDYLHTKVFPNLSEKLLERYHYLEPIDLRWGIETSSNAKHFVVGGDYACFG